MDVAQETKAPENGESTRVKWDEEQISSHLLERGVEYGTMKIDHPDTPFLYYEEEQDPPCAQNIGPGVPPAKMEVEELQQALGLLSDAEESGVKRFHQPKWQAVEGDAAASSFAQQRAALYSDEAGHAALQKGLPEGWVVARARSEPRDYYYVHELTGETTWDRPQA